MKKTGLIGLVVILALGFYSFNRYSTDYFELTKNLEIFANVYKEVNSFYFEDLDHGKLMKKGIDAMLGSLDPYTVFVSENQVERARYMAEGRYDGVGMEIEEMDGQIVVTFVYSGFGAHDAGIMAGDIVEKMEGRELAGFEKEDVIVFMRGASGTDLNMTVYRPWEDRRFTAKVERQEVSVPNVPYSGMIEDGIAYVALTTFTPGSARNITSSLRALRDEHDLDGIVLDLRDNGGGLLTEAINVSNIFIPNNKLVVSTKGKLDEWNRTFETSSNPFDTETPLVVLINEKSASASEIVSGVMQDYDRGVLIGNRTYGKGLVQNVRQLGYNTQVRITTSEYFIPSGRGIQNVRYEDGRAVDIPDSLRAVFSTTNGREVLGGGGVAPDIEVPAAEKPEVIRELQKRNLIFDYATYFRSQVDSIPEPGDFNFDRYDEFISFVEDRDFDFDLDAEKTLGNLVAQAEGGLYSDDIERQIRQIRSVMRDIKSTAFEDHKDQIVRLLEDEIISRYYFQEGKTRQNLTRDHEIQEAIKVLKDPERFRQILARK
jgi:carboxyl-terminal processing protease